MGNSISVIDRETRWDQKISFYIAFYFFASVANAAVKTVLYIPDVLWTPLSLLWGAAILFFMFRCIGEVWRRQKRVFYYSIIVFLFIYLVSFLNISTRGEPYDVFFKGTVLLTFAWWIPIGVSVIAVKNKRVLYDELLKWSYPMALALYSCLFFRQPTVGADTFDEFETEYSMFFGFHMILPCLLHFTEYQRTKKKTLLMWSLVDFLLIFIYSNRGALIPILFFVFYKYFVESRINIQKRLGRLLLLFIGGGALIIFSNVILEGVGSAAEAFGVRSRTLAMLESGEITNSTGRDELFSIAYDMILDRPVLGYGLGGEYYTISKYLYGGRVVQVTNAFTPHNGVLQNLCNFGIVLGSIVTLLFFIPLFRLNKIKDEYTYSLALIFGAWTIPMYISASGFLMETWSAVFFYLYYFSKKRA